MFCSVLRFVVAATMVAVLMSSAGLACNNLRPTAYQTWGYCQTYCFGYYVVYDCFPAPGACCHFGGTTMVDCGDPYCMEPVTIAVYVGGYNCT